MLLLCYAQHLGYLFHTMFPSLSILQHYAEFNTCTIVTLQKLLGAGFFGGSVGHLVHCQTTILVFLDRVGLSSMVRIVALVFLGCWGLIVPALVIHFQQDYCPILLDVLTHVEINISPFQMALGDVQAMLPQIAHFHVPPFESLVVQFYIQLQYFLVDFLHAQKFASLSIDVPLDIARTHLCSCVSPRASTWLLAHFITPTFCLSSAHLFTTLRICFGLPHPIVAHLSWC